jgi:deoxycytidine triphosphate deaminase
VNIALLNPEWEGRLVIQIGNLAPLPNRVYINEGITQIVFCEASEVCRRRLPFKQIYSATINKFFLRKRN